MECICYFQGCHGERHTTTSEAKPLSDFYFSLMTLTCEKRSTEHQKTHQHLKDSLEVEHMRGISTQALTFVTLQSDAVK